MCAAVDMLASPQYLYSHSPPAGFLADYALPGLPINGISPPQLRRANVNRGTSAPVLPPHLKTIKLKLSPQPRSILRRDGGPKKRVAFADDRGLPLEQIRIMTEPSHVPPYWIVDSDTARPRAEQPSEPTDRWEIRFVQPASDYVGFRARITDENVSLENVIVKESESLIEGTVKVKNIIFHKTVFVRSTSDGWRTHEDTFCAYSECISCGNGVVSLYDTFAFRLQLPVHSRRLEFCVCFSCRGEEFWDNNRGENYVIERRYARSDGPAVAVCGRVNSGNRWSARQDSVGNTPYW